ncbi:hypothetical protein MMC29_007616 [Sticta canariensis]|nr:hypothetical protein [Sticta canariensis]
MHERLFTSAKNRHWAVFVSSIGLLLLQLATIFSTGLLVLEPTELTESEVPFSIRAGFNSSGFDLSVTGSAAAQQVYGVESGKLPYPSDTTENLVIQKFDPPSRTSVSTYTAEVQGFSTNLDCETLHLSNVTETPLPWFSILAPYYVVNIRTDSCHIKNAIIGQGAEHNYFRDNKVTDNFQGRFQNFTCNTGGDSSVAPSILAINGHLQWAPHLPVTPPSATWVKQLTVVLCKPTYSIDNYSVSLTPAGDILRMQTIKKPGTNSTLKDFDDSKLIQAVRASFKKITFGEGGADYVVTQVPSFFQVMKAVHDVPTLEPFMDLKLLQDLGSRIFKGASANIAHQNLMASQYSSTSGSLTYTEDRLQVKRVTVGLMAICLGLLVCISILEVFVRPWNTVSCEPKSISALSTILVASKSLRQRLIGTGFATSDGLHRRLSEKKFQTAIIQQETDSFVIEPAPDPTEMVGSPPSSSVDGKVKWWRPMAVRSWFTALIIVLPLCFIGILQALQHVLR